MYICVEIDLCDEMRISCWDEVWCDVNLMLLFLWFVMNMRWYDEYEMRWEKNKWKEKEEGGSKGVYAGQNTFVPPETPPVQMWGICTNAKPYLYQVVCTGWIPSRNKGYQPVQIVIFPSSGISPSTKLHIIFYREVCIGWITCANEGYRPT
jgi:hypothetical protein